MQSPHSFNEMYRQIVVRRVPFLVTFAVTVFLTYAFLYAIDFIPQAPGTGSDVKGSAATTTTTTNAPVTATTTTAQPAPEAATVAPATTEKPKQSTPAAATTIATAPSMTYPAVAAADEPLLLIFDSLNNKQVKVLNPTSDNIEVLDQALLSGAVHYPGSANFSEPGNIFILAHSSYLPNVINKNFQSFNGIQNLTWGDHIRVRSADTEYTYRVETVVKTTASDAVVMPTPGKATLTLATCDVLAAKEDRFVVTAVLIDSKPLTVASR